METQKHKALMRECYHYYRHCQRASGRSRADIKKNSEALCGSIEDYQEEHPEATHREIQQIFFTALPTGNKQTYRIRKIIIIFLTALLIVFGTYLVFKNLIPYDTDYSNIPTYYIED